MCPGPVLPSSEAKVRFSPRFCRTDKQQISADVLGSAEPPKGSGWRRAWNLYQTQSGSVAGPQRGHLLGPGAQMEPVQFQIPNLEEQQIEVKNRSNESISVGQWADPVRSLNSSSTKDLSVSDTRWRLLDCPPPPEPTRLLLRCQSCHRFQGPGFRQTYLGHRLHLLWGISSGPGGGEIKRRNNKRWINTRSPKTRNQLLSTGLRLKTP